MGLDADYELDLSLRKEEGPALAGPSWVGMDGRKVRHMHFYGAGSLFWARGLAGRPRFNVRPPSGNEREPPRPGRPAASLTDKERGGGSFGRAHQAAPPPSRQPAECKSSRPVFSPLAASHFISRQRRALAARAQSKPN